MHPICTLDPPVLKRLLAHPLTKGMDPDDPQTTALRRRIIKEKAFLRGIYEEWYAALAQAVPDPAVCRGKVLELGSGGGFLDETLPECLRSEVFHLPGVDLVLDARRLPFAAHSLRALLMVDVLHHIPDATLFFREAERVLAPGGVIALWEPWNTPLSRRLFTLHHEPFEPEAADWPFPERGPLSGANGALPWIIFERDLDRFRQDFPLLRLESLTRDFPLSYLLSGGVSLRSLLPGLSLPLVRGLERLAHPFDRFTAMFAFIVVRRIPG